MELKLYKEHHLPPEMWDRIYTYLDLQSKKTVRLVCRMWNDMINSENQWSMYTPVLKRTDNRLPTIPPHLWKELTNGRYKKCSEVKYYPEQLLKLTDLQLESLRREYSPNPVTTKSYATFHPKEITENLDQMRSKLYTAEEAASSCYKIKKHKYQYGKAFKHTWKLHLQLKIGTKPPEEQEITCGICLQEKNKCAKLSNVLVKVPAPSKHHKNRTSYIFTKHAFESSEPIARFEDHWKVLLNKEGLL